MVWTVSGAHNIHAEAAFRDTAEMKEVLDKVLHKTREIQEYYMSIMMKPVKEVYSLSQKIIASIKRLACVRKTPSLQQSVC